MKKKLLLFIVGVALLGGIYGYYQWNKPHQDITSSKADLSLVANDLLLAFEEDETKANGQYLDKLIIVNGVIKDLEKNETGETTVILATENDMSSIICNLDPLSKHDTKSLKVGQNINLKGLCSGFLMDVVLDRCVIQN